MIDLLTKEQLYELTGAKQPKKQADILLMGGIHYVTRADGTIATTKHWVDHPFSVAAVPASNGIDLSKVA